MRASGHRAGTATAPLLVAGVACLCPRLQPASPAPSQFHFPSTQTKDKPLGQLCPFDALQAVFPTCGRVGGHSLSHRWRPLCLQFGQLMTRWIAPSAVVPKALSLAGPCVTDGLRSQPSPSASSKLGSGVRLLGFKAQHCHLQLCGLCQAT